MASFSEHHHHHHHSRRKARRKYQIRRIRRWAVVVCFSVIAAVCTAMIFMYGVNDVPGVDAALLHMLPMMLLLGALAGGAYYGLSLYSISKEQRD